MGTVYRHFPTKDALVEALFADRLDGEIERASTTAEEADGWEALVTYLEETMLAQAGSFGLRALMCPAGSVHPTVQACKEVINPYVERMVEAAHRQDTLRTDCDATDIAYVQVALVASPGAERPLLARCTAQGGWLRECDDSL